MHDQGPSAIDIAAEILGGNPDIGLEDAKAQAALRGLKLHPLQLYRAKVRLGLAAPPAPRRKAEVEEPAPVVQLPRPPVHEAQLVPIPQPGPVRVVPLRAARPTTEGLAKQLAEQMQATFEEQWRLRKVIEQVIEVLEAALRA